MNNLKEFQKNLLKPETQEHLENLIGENKNEFITNMLSLVSNNAGLQKCTPDSILNCGMKATSLNLSLDDNLGEAYAIPYSGKAQFQLGYKGLVQLCLRSGQFKKINSIPIKKGELKGVNPLTEMYNLQFEENLDKRAKLETVGYMAYFLLKDGREHTKYMSMEEVINHADKFSSSFSKNKKTGSTPWYTNFERMAQKTVLKLLLNAYAPKSIKPLNEALVADEAIINDVKNIKGSDYEDNPIRMEAAAKAEDPHNPEFTATETSPEVENNDQEILCPICDNKIKDDGTCPFENCPTNEMTK